MTNYKIRIADHEPRKSQWAIASFAIRHLPLTPSVKGSLFAIHGVRRLAPAALIAATMLFAFSTASAQSGGDYVITKSTVSAAGHSALTGGDYRASGTAGQHDAADLAGGDYALLGGFWSPAPDDFEPPTCPPSDPVDTDEIEAVVSAKNRFLTITTGDENSLNRGRDHAIRVTIESLPAPYDGLAGAELWVGIPTGAGSDVERLSSIAGTGLGDAIPGSDTRFLRVAQLRCGPPSPQASFYRDWTDLHSCRGGGAGVNATDCDPTDPGACGGDPSLCVRDEFIHLYHPLIIPDGFYRAAVIDESCDPTLAADFSTRLDLDASRFGDLAGGTNCSPPAENTWCAPDGNTVVGDVVAAIDTFGNKPIGPIKPRAEAAGLGVSPVDGIIGVSDLVVWVDAVLGKPMTITPMAPPIAPPCP